jgi:nicotinamidase/pyrazinamidase
MKTQLLIIDPQNDFTDPQGSLYVPGAKEDMQRLTKVITNLPDAFDQIHVTLDSHQEIDIAHPVYWIDKQGNQPQPFSTISLNDMKEGKWKPYRHDWHERAINYLSTLEENNRHQHTIWPPHCIIGSWGHAVQPDLSDALRKWEKERFCPINFISKGTNIWTEHYSAIKAEVEDQKDPSTCLNIKLLDALKNSETERIFIAGEALSHCVANTVRDIVANFDETNISKLTLLLDCCSNVPTCEELGEKFLSDMKKCGVKTALSTEI